MDYARKALDSVVGANYERKDLSDVITMQDGPERPVLRTIKSGKAKGKTHYWNEVGLNPAGHGTNTYAEGQKPPGNNNTPTQLSNVVCRVGAVAQVTDTEAAIWTGAGSYELKDGELERLYQEAIDMDTAIKTEQVLNEMEWMLCNGDQTNPESWAGGQCDGIFKRITTNVTTYPTSAPLNVAASNAAAYETAIRALAQQIRQLYTPRVPDLMLVTAPQKAGINAFVGGGAGRPLVQVINNGQPTGLVAGQEVDEYQTGYFKLSVQIEPQIEITALAGKASPPTTAQLGMIDSAQFSRCDLIPLGAEPLARIATMMERMVTCEFTLEIRNQKSSGKISGCNG